MVNLNGHEAGNGGHSQGTPTAYRELLYSERGDLSQTSNERRIVANHSIRKADFLRITSIVPDV
jgi:hypothetical protein